MAVTVRNPHWDPAAEVWPRMFLGNWSPDTTFSQLLEVYRRLIVHLLLHRRTSQPSLAIPCFEPGFHQVIVARSEPLLD